MNRARQKSALETSEATLTFMISSANIDRIKRQSLLSSFEEPHSSPSSGDDSEQQRKMEKALARKARMLALEEKRHKDNQNDDDIFADKRAKEIRKEAQKKIDQSNDIAKRIKTYSERAMAFTIRDQQLLDRGVIAEQEKAYEDHMNLAMEIVRLKGLDSREAEENAKILKRIADRKVIEDQIEYRRQQRLLADEAREQENRQMIRSTKELEEEQEKLGRQRIEQAQQNCIEFTIANEDAIAAKKTRGKLEKEEEQQLLAYQLDRDEAMRRRETEEGEANLRKRELQKKMLENQTKLIDKQAQLDQLRARRATEEAERKYRKKVLQEARNRKEGMLQLNEARTQQEEERQIAQQRGREEKIEEYQSATKLAHDMAKRERDEADAREVKNTKLRLGLQEQILDMESNRRRQQLGKFEEGRRRKEEMAAERASLEALRDQGVAELRSKGVHEKYLTEILSIDVEKLLMR